MRERGRILEVGHGSARLTFATQPNYLPINPESSVDAPQYNHFRARIYDGSGLQVPWHGQMKCPRRRSCHVRDHRTAGTSLQKSLHTQISTGQGYGGERHW